MSIEDHGKLTAIELSPKLEWASAFVDGINKNRKAKRLSASLRSQLSAIETLGNEVDFLWLDVQAAWYAYYDAVGAYNYAVSPEERIGIREPTKQTPTAIFLCAGSCDALFETASLAQVSHQMYCQEKHGASGTTGVTFYLCSGSCNRSHQHWKECRASACSVLFPPAEHEHTSDYYDHKVRCTESVYSVWNLNAKCGEEYFTCEHSTCPVSNTHWSGSGSGSGGSTPPSGGNPPPSMLACGIHSSGTSGDHSLQASCSSSNANGSCTGTGFYACSHSHDYPSPPPPTTVSCRRSACNASVSSSTEHRVGPCSACGSSYWSCGTYASYSENQHRSRTCRRSGCGNTWQRCTSSTPSCNAKSGSGCWAQ